MNSLKRLAREYGQLRRILAPRDFLALLACTITRASSIAHTGKLTAVDAAMSRNLRIRFRGSLIDFPLADVDRVLSGTEDNPTFGNVREMCGRDCYLRLFNLNKPVGTVLDLGANRGIFSLLALLTLGADRTIGVEPLPKYIPALQLLLTANNINPELAIRYRRFVTSPARERQDPGANVSIESICKEQGIDRFGFVKIDIEGAEKDLFNECAWLDRVDNLAMELHPQFAGDLSAIPLALARSGFQYRIVSSSGDVTDVNRGEFLYASRVGSLTTA